jgi:hypothetical protein
MECEVCGNALTYPEALQIKNENYIVCRSFDCRRIIRQKESMPSHMFNSHVKFQNKLVKDNRDRQAQLNLRIEQVFRKQRLEHDEILQSVLQENNELSKNDIQHVVIPKGLAKVSAPNQEHIDAYNQHLNTIINEAGNYASAHEVILEPHSLAREKLVKVENKFRENPASREISDQLCGMCKGGCCISGNQHAYLSTITIRRLMDNDPALTQQQVLELYQSHISTQTIEGSCINHTSNGCALPRELRSDICNAFYCDPLKTYQNNLDTNKNNHRLLVIQRASTYSSWIDPDIQNEIIDYTLIKGPDTLVSSNEN